MQNITISYRIISGKLEFKSKQDELLYTSFISSNKENDIVEVYYSIEQEKSLKTPAQLAKIHKLIREIALETGNDFDDIKELVKDKAGLYNDEDNFKSFKDCSKEELMLAINTAISIGMEAGLKNVY